MTNSHVLKLNVRYSSKSVLKLFSSADSVVFYTARKPTGDGCWARKVACLARCGRMLTVERTAIGCSDRQFC